jgi:hypothetical protein
MSSLAVLKNVLKLLEARDLEGFLAMLSADCIIMKDRGEKIAHGPDELRAFYTPIFTGQESLKITLANEFETGSIVACREVNTDLEVDGVKTNMDSVWVYRVLDGKIAYMHVFSPTAEADHAMNALY